jgi:signal transduction histidine kinase
MAAAGPGMTTLRSVAARIARTIRCLAIAYVVVQVVIWHSFYAADPWRLAGPAAVVAWAAAMVAYLRRRWPVWPVAGIDSGFHVALALSAGWCVPPAMRGDAANWLYIVMTGQFFIPAWFAPTVVSVPLALASAASYWAGATMTLGTGSAGSSPGASTALLLAIAAANLCGRRMLYRRAMGADNALAQADRDVREQYVVLSRNIERREHERLLHDTVLNTLTALTRAGSTDAAGVVGRCRRDVTLMEYVLSDPCDPAEGTGRAYGGLLAAIEAIAIEMRARGLAVHVDVAQGVPAGPGGAPAVPVTVVVAVAHAVREALANVVSHAGTGEAWVDISLAPGGEVAEPGGLQVTVRDAGVGFEPARVDPARLGLRRSIIERIADRGGQASVCSAPGEGTVVSLCWTAWPHPEPDAVASVTPDRADLTW